MNVVSTQKSFNHACKEDILATIEDAFNATSVYSDQVIKHVKTAHIPLAEKARIETRIRIWRGYAARSKSAAKGRAWLAHYPILRYWAKDAVEECLSVNLAVREAISAIEIAIPRA